MIEHAKTYEFEDYQVLAYIDVDNDGAYCIRARVFTGDLFWEASTFFEKGCSKLAALTYLSRADIIKDMFRKLRPALAVISKAETERDG